MSRVFELDASWEGRSSAWRATIATGDSMGIVRPYMLGRIFRKSDEPALTRRGAVHS